MSLAEIKDAIEHLSFEERAKLEAFLHPYSEDEWDKQIKTDLAPGGNLAWLVKEVDADIANDAFGRA